MEVIKKLNNTTGKGTGLSKKYITASYKYTKLKLFQLTTLSISTIVKLFCIGGLVSFGLIFLSISVAIFLGEYYNNTAFGYAVVGLFFLMISLVIFLMRKNLEKRVIQKMAKVFFD